MDLLGLVSAHIGTFITTVVGGGVGAYLSSYLKKKGEHLATHEDIDKLVDQVKAVTQATKDIEARVSDDYWGKQRRWDLQRDTFLAVIDAIGKFQGDTNRLIALAIVAQRQPPGKENAELDETLKATAQSLTEQAPGLMTLSFRVALVGSSQVQTAVTELHKILLSSQEVMRHRDFERAVVFGSAVEQATLRTLAVVRGELGFPDLSPSPRSGGPPGV